MYKFYPNPVQDRFFVKVNQADQQDIQLVIFDLTGSLVLQEKLRSNEARAIETSNWSTGVYILQLRSSNGQHSQKLIVD